MKALIVSAAVILSATFCAAESVEDLPRTADGMVIIQGEAEIILENGKVKEVIRGRSRRTRSGSRSRSTSSGGRGKSSTSARGKGSTPSAGKRGAPSARNRRSTGPGAGTEDFFPGGRPGDMLPGGDGPMDDAKGGGEAKPLRVRMFLDSDKLYLRDGTTIEGTIIIVAAKWAIILTEEGEKLIPREDIEKIEHGRDKFEAVTLPIRESDGFQFIIMEPIEEGEDVEGELEEAPEYNAPAKEPKKKQPVVAKKKKDTPSLEKLDMDEIRKLLDKDKDLDKLLEKMKKDGGRFKGKPPPTVKW